MKLLIRLYEEQMSFKTGQIIREYLSAREQLFLEESLKDCLMDENEYEKYKALSYFRREHGEPLEEFKEREFRLRIKFYYDC
jgi:hypothetical protein